MNYAEYVEVTEVTEINKDLYRALFKDVAQCKADRVNAILHTFLSLDVPRDYTGDVGEIKAEGLIEIARGTHAADMLEYAAMLWLLPRSVFESLFHSIEQLLD
jgi:hypothetical protein